MNCGANCMVDLAAFTSGRFFKKKNNNAFTSLRRFPSSKSNKYELRNGRKIKLLFDCIPCPQCVIPEQWIFPCSALEYLNDCHDLRIILGAETKCLHMPRVWNYLQIILFLE